MHLEKSRFAPRPSFRNACLIVLGTLAVPGAATAQERQITVAPGDTLRGIAMRELGDVGQWRAICDLNSAVIGADCDRILTGSQLRLPGVAGAAAPAPVAVPVTPVPAPAEIPAPAPAAAPEQLTESPPFALDLRMPDDVAALQSGDDTAYLTTATSDGVRLSGHQAEKPSPGGLTGGMIFVIDAQTEVLFSGQPVRVDFVLIADQAGSVEAAYSTADVGNSGWRTLALQPGLNEVSFDYDVPVMNNGNRDYIGLLPDPEGTGQTVIVQSVTVNLRD